MSLDPLAKPTSRPAPTSVAAGIAAPGLRTSARTTTYSAAIVSAAPGHSFIVVPSVARPIAAVIPMATAHPTASQRSGRGRSANSSGASRIAKYPAMPAGAARTTEIVRGSQPASTIRKNGRSSSGLWYVCSCAAATSIVYARWSCHHAQPM